MAFLQIGALVVTVQTGAREDAPLAPDITSRNQAGGMLISRTGAVNRVWRVDTKPLTDAEYAALVTATPVTGTVAVTGTALGTVTCVVTRERVSHLKVKLTRRRVVSLSLEEV